MPGLKESDAFNLCIYCEEITVMPIHLHNPVKIVNFFIFLENMSDHVENFI